MRVVNIPATFKLDSELDLFFMNLMLQSGYNPRKFNGLVHRFSNPRCTAIFFRTGFVTLTGSKSLEDLNQTCHNVIRLLFDLGYENLRGDLKIQTFVAAGNFHQSFSLTNVYETMREFGFLYDIYPSYEPELFPALITKFKDKSWSCSLFRNGKFHITGCKSLDEVTKVKEIIEEIALYKGYRPF